MNSDIQSRDAAPVAATTRHVENQNAGDAVFESKAWQNYLMS
jgi:hypothetical protein